MRISDWSSDVCSSDLPVRHRSRTSRWHFRPQRPVTAMVGAADAACLAVVSAPTLLLMWQCDYRTGTGEMRNVTLSDGSSVTLDTGRAIAVNDRKSVALGLRVSVRVDIGGPRTIKKKK